MKVLLLTHRFSPDIGGIESISEMLADYFFRQDCELRVVTWTAEEGAKKFPYTVIRKPSVGQLFKQHAWADVVFENNPCLRLSWPAALYNKKSVVGLQTWTHDGKGNNLQAGFKHIWLKRAKKVIACSQAIRSGCWPNAEVIGNPYQHKVFSRLPAVHRTENFIFVGRLVSDKGADVAIEAFKKLVDKDPAVFGSLSLTIVGDGPEKENLEKQVEAAKLSGKVSFTGSLRGEALVKALNAHKAMLVPSKWEEPFGIVALEGLACGCIPVVSNAGGLPSAIGHAGLTFKTGDSSDLAEKIFGLYKNEPLQQQLKTAAAHQLRVSTADYIGQQYWACIKQAAN